MDSSDDESLAGLTQVPSEKAQTTCNSSSDSSDEDAAGIAVFEPELVPLHDKSDMSCPLKDISCAASQDLFLTPPITQTVETDHARKTLDADRNVAQDTSTVATANATAVKEKYVVETEDISDAEMCSAMEEYERSQVDNSHEGGKRPCSEPPGKALQHRFKKPQTCDEMENLGKKKYSPATCTKIEWAMRAYNHWVDYRRKMYIGRVNNPNPKEQWRQVDRLDQSCKQPILLSRDVCDFIAEVRKENGSEYPPGTIYDLVLMLSLYLEREFGIDRLTTTAWPKIRNTLNAIMQEKTAEGYGHTNERDYVSEEQEDFLWQEGYLGSDNPDKLRLTVFFLLGKNFALRGGSEHRDLVRYPSSQIKIESPDKDKIYLVYREFKSKTNQGGISCRNVKKPRVAYAFPNEQNKDRCPVALFVKYVRYCPLGSDDSTAFYLRSNVNWQTSKLWYTNQPIGKGMLNDYLKNLMSDAGFVGNYTNHSLRATTATRLFHSNCPEQLIAEQTGHSSNAIRRYKKSNLAQKQEVSRLLAGSNSGQNNVPKVADSKEGKHVETDVKRNENVPLPSTIETSDNGADCSKDSSNGTNVNVSVPNMQQNLSGLVNIHFHFNK